MFEMSGKYTTAKVFAAVMESKCSSQVYGFLNHPAFTNPVAVMPDTHAGEGSVIGFTMPITDKVIPNVIGVDIGCGMLSICLGELQIDDFDRLDQEIRERIPTGASVHETPVVNVAAKFPWNNVTRAICSMKKAAPGNFSYETFKARCKEIGIDLRYAECSLGTLGGGNHFIEMGRSGAGELWLTVHSGSRNLGKKVCEYWQRRANGELRNRQQTALKAEIEKIKATCRGKEIEDRIREVRAKMGFGIPSALAWLEGEQAAGYISDMLFAQVYAHVNRALIAGRILDILDNTMGLKVAVQDRIETIHNFIDPGDMIIRKGAIRSYTGERMIIPFNMRDGFAICEGKSNPEWNFSAPHGAGRLMSRADAKKTVDMDRFREQMSGIFSTSVCRGTLDEAPEAYKDTREILELIEPTVKIHDMVRPVYNLKDTTSPEEHIELLRDTINPASDIAGHMKGPSCS